MGHFEERTPRTISNKDYLAALYKLIVLDKERQLYKIC